MGCWDVFCLLCGNSYFADTANAAAEYFEQELEYNETWQKACDKNKNIVAKLEDFINKTQWVRSCVFLTLDNRVIHGCTNQDCGNTFSDNKNNQYIHAPWEYKHGQQDIKKDYGVFVHTDCWKYIKEKHKIELNFSHLPFINNKMQIDDRLYHPIDIYQQQSFDFISAFIDGNSDYCLSPLVKPTIINKVFSSLKLKKSDTRKSPITSATLYSVGTYKVGNNGNIWVIEKGKWSECKDTVEKELEMKIKKFQKFRYIGESNQNPVFIKSKTINGSDVVIKFVTLTSYIKKI